MKTSATRNSKPKTVVEWLEVLFRIPENPRQDTADPDKTAP